MATRRTKSVSTKVTEAEYDVIARRAEPLTVSEWARGILLGATQPDPLHFLLLAENEARNRQVDSEIGPTVVRREASFHDFDGYERLVDAARVKGWRTHLIVLLGGEAGLRVGEMVALHWADVDVSRRRLCVRHSDWRGTLTAPKNGRVRYVPLTERLLEALREYRHLRGPRVLCKDDGRPLSRQSAWTRVRRAVRQAGVPTGVHILRHTFCSHLAMQGAPGKAIQELAGHQEMSVTQGYMHLSPDALGSSIQLLDRRPRLVERGDIVETASAQNGS